MYFYPHDEQYYPVCQSGPRHPDPSAADQPGPRVIYWPESRTLVIQDPGWRHDKHLTVPVEEVLPDEWADGLASCKLLADWLEVKHPSAVSSRVLALLREPQQRVDDKPILLRPGKQEELGRWYFATHELKARPGDQLAAWRLDQLGEHPLHPAVEAFMDCTLFDSEEDMYSELGEAVARLIQFSADLRLRVFRAKKKETS